MARTSTGTRSTTFARAELLLAQLLWALARLAPQAGDHGRIIIRQALDRGIFELVAFYGCNPEGLCEASLRLGIAAGEHLELRRLRPRVQVGRYWEDGIAPDLRQLVEHFADIVDRCGLTVKALLRTKQEADLVVNGQVLPRTALPVPAGRMIGPSGPIPIAKLEELKAHYALFEGAAPSAP